MRDRPAPPVTPAERFFVKRRGDSMPFAAGTESSAGVNGFGAGLSGTLQVSDGVSLNLGGRYFDSDTATAGNEGYQISAQLVAAVTETITLSGEIGVYGQNSGGAGATFTTPDTCSVAGGCVAYGSGAGTGVLTAGAALPTAGNAPGTWDTVEYGAASLAWAPGGGFTSSISGAAYTNGAYVATFNAGKTFQ